MVLAYAALFLQLAAPAQPANSTTVTSSSTTVENPESGNANAGNSEADTTDTHPGKASVDPGPAFRNVRLGEAPSGAATDPVGIKDVALDLDETGQGLSTIRVPEIKKPQNNPIQEPEVPSRRTWLALALAEHAAASFDAYSTRLAVSHGAVEDDPLMRPFAHSDAIYAAAQAGPLLFDYLARKMQRSDNLTLRRFWWLPQSVSTGVSLFAGVHNIHVVNSITK
jgi:hypothetical protein